MGVESGLKPALAGYCLGQGDEVLCMGLTVSSSSLSLSPSPAFQALLCVMVFISSCRTLEFGGGQGPLGLSPTCGPPAGGLGITSAGTQGHL